MGHPGGQQGEQQGEQAAGAGAAESKRDVMEEDVEQEEPTSATGKDLHLLNLLDTVGSGSASVLHRLATVLTRIEDLSHILVWTTSDNIERGADADADADSSWVHIALVELPRLKVRFQPMKGADGAVRLHLLEQGGWFVSDLLTADANAAATAPPG